MSIYSGNKSLDAEIHLDLISGKIELDYSLNKKGSPYDDSNASVILKNDFKTLKRFEKIKVLIKKSPIIIFSLVYAVTTTPLLAFLTHHNLIKNKNYQVEHQRILKWLLSNVSGTTIKIIEAPLDSSRIEYHVGNNIWMEYRLEGDFQNEIKDIFLKRHFKTKKIFGIYENVRQRGWDLIFEFKNPPKTGKCIIEHV